MYLLSHSVLNTSAHQPADPFSGRKDKDLSIKYKGLGGVTVGFPVN